MHLVLLGAPGSGKGTQATALCAALRLPHVSTGALFREHIERASPLGIQVKDCISRGALVPDEVTVPLLRARLIATDARDGVVLDGFPRTVEQAESLDVMLWSLRRQLDTAVYIDVPDDDIVDRLSGRMVCRECDAPFHVTANPFSKCPQNKCHGEHLYRRDDDQPDTVRARLLVFHRTMQPILDYYRNRDRLVWIDGRGAVDQVNHALLGALRLRAAHA